MSEKGMEAYIQVLEDLKRRKKALESLISVLEGIVASKSVDGDTSAIAVELERIRLGPDFMAAGGWRGGDGERAAGAADLAILPEKFQRWTLSSAILWILEASEKSLSNADILSRLLEGGFRFKSKNTAVAIAQCLKRLDDKAMVRRIARGKWAKGETA